MAQLKTTSALAKILSKLVWFGDISGKLLTLIALPSALLAIYAFYDEIGDVLTIPDVSAQIESVNLRCALAIDVIPKGEDPSEFAKRTCVGSAPLSAWVKLSINNEDSINRTLIAIALKVKFPDGIGFGDEHLIWTQSRSVRHIIENDQQSTQRIVWNTLLLWPGQEIRMEVDFRAFEKENQKSFRKFVALIRENPSPLTGASVEFELVGRFAGEKEWLSMSRCKVTYPAKTIAGKRDVEFFRSITRRCK